MSAAAPRRRSFLRRLGVVVALTLAVGLVTLAAAMFLISRADGPLFVFAGGPLRAGDPVAFGDMEWDRLDELRELEMEIVGVASSRTLWFNVHEGIPYVGCDLDCVGGRLTRWPQQIEEDDRVVIRIDAKRVDGRLVHVPHGSDEYEAAKASRIAKYWGDAGDRAGAETAAHTTVVVVGESLTGRSRRDEPGDRLYRVAPR